MFLRPSSTSHDPPATLNATELYYAILHLGPKFELWLPIAAFNTKSISVGRQLEYLRLPKDGIVPSSQIMTRSP